MQRPSVLVMVPEDPYLKKVHLVTLGKTTFMGSALSEGSEAVIVKTSQP